MRLITVASIASLGLALGACEEKKPAPPPPSGATGTTGGGHDHDHEHVIQLGASKVGPFDANASRDEGPITAGKDAGFDVTVVPATGGTAKAVAVRFWIGTEDAKGSVKAKADIEDPKHPSTWHTHAEVPNPIPDGARLWVEIEDDKGGKSVGSFDLKM